jgi:tRNA G18 (ribose-2'-O)-methylase SpoU
MEINRIRTLDSLELQPYRTLRRAAEHIRRGIFVAEGEKVVRRLLESPIEVVSLLLTEEWLQDLRPDLKRISDGKVKAWVAPKESLESIVGFPLHQGVMAIGKIPEPVNLADVIRPSSSPRLLVALDGLTNADNVGVIVRNCVAFGVNALIVPKNSSNPYLRRAVRMSMGAVFSLPIVQVQILAEACRDLENQFGIRAVAAHPKPDAASIEDADLNGDLCLVLGSEGNGISEEVIAICSEKVSIPISHGTDSLNVATASGILLFEIQRRREPMTKQRGTSIASAPGL